MTFVAKKTLFSLFLGVLVFSVRSGQALLVTVFFLSYVFMNAIEESNFVSSFMAISQ